jgi:glycosyltransferase involved in cell wall biosynthesis
MDRLSQPLVSVVTPVYNGADYLAECIESISAQTYRAWEHIIVDNCSTDASVAIARRYAARDSRIKIRENSEFLEVIPNHNRALQQISPSSKYCKVVFADDWILPECIEKMVAVAEKYSRVGLVGAYCLEGTRVTCTGLPYSTEVVDGRQICRYHLIDGLYLFGSPNSVLYRAELLQGCGAFYNEGSIHADTEACFAVLRNSDFGFVHQVLTFTRVRPGSLTSMSNDLQTSFAGALHILRAHGDYYLSREECDACLEKHLDGYYRFLAKSFIQRRDRRFWDYHKQQLAGADLSFSRVRMAKAFLELLGSAAERPLALCMKLRHAGIR